MSWYVVETHIQNERLALAGLKRQKFNALMPSYEERRVIRNQIVDVVLPLFPRYLLVELDLDRQQWRSVCYTYGVRRILGSNFERPTALPDAVAAELLARCADGPLEDARFVIGTLLSIVHGPMAGMKGRVSGGTLRRVELSLWLLGRQTVVTLPFEVVRRAA